MPTFLVLFVVNLTAQAVEMPGIWDEMTAMWRHCNELTNMNPLSNILHSGKTGCYEN